MHVLLVEDDELVRMCLLDLLTDAGIEAVTASTGNEALENAEGLSEPAVLISDVCLGLGMNGIDLAAAARRRWPKVRVILMSGSTELAEAAAEFTGHADAVLLKPFRTDTFVSAVLQVAHRCAGQNQPADVH